MPRKKTAAPETAPAPAEEVVHSIKGFNKDWTCRGFQFEPGKTYEHDSDVKACSAGFHAIEGHPLKVFVYYPPGTSHYAEVIQSGALSRRGNDSNLASAKITIGVEIKLHDLIQRAIKRVFDLCAQKEGEHATGYRGAASSTGDQGAASSTGDQGAASSTGDYGAASSTGDQGAASSTGDQGAASSTGDYGAASSTGYRGAASSTGNYGAASSTGDLGAASSTGYRGAASSTGYRGAASSTGNYGAASSTGYRGAASSTGNYGAASSTGYQGAASSTGDQGAASSTGNYGAASSTGYQGAAMAIGRKARVMGYDGNALFTVYRDPDTDEILHAWSGIVGRDGIKAGVWYRLDETGKPVEAV